MMFEKLASVRPKLIDSPKVELFKVTSERLDTMR